MIWWNLTRQYAGPAATSCAISTRTSQPDHCYVAWAPWMPRRHELWRIFRGKDILCGYKYIWDTPNITEQITPGDTMTHVFNLQELTPSTTHWYYIFAPDGPYGREIQGPLSTFTTLPLAPGPEPTDDPIRWDLLNRHNRCGNHYTWWANGTWYAMLPSIDSITVWKLQAGVMVRKDHAHEPVPPAGNIWDADSRLSPDATTLHVSHFIRTVAPDPHLLRYATFDLTTDLWALDEPICSPGRPAWPGGTTSISLDADHKPHVVYSDDIGGWAVFRYRNRITGAWSAPELALDRDGRHLEYSSLDHDPATNHLHLLCGSNVGWNYVNRRSPAGVWDGRTNLSVVSINLAHDSVATGVELPHFAQIGATWRVNHHEGTFPYICQLDLSDPTSHFANAISPPVPNPEPGIVFADDALALTLLYRPAGQPWDAPLQVHPGPVGVLACTYAHPQIISCLWRGAGASATYLHAFVGPWP